ncbi:MAG: hypothetical protein GC152_01215 [Alphaproteobacteria bacterium]|nr:hypothetical protein [Alphaproteobacteria bacterium]
MQNVGAPFFERLASVAQATTDLAIRSAGAGARARTKDHALNAKFMADVQAGKFGALKSVCMIIRQLARRTTIWSTFNWMRNNPNAAIGSFRGSFRFTFFPKLGRSLCSAEALPGNELVQAQTMAPMALCAALKKAGGADLAPAVAGQ